MSLPSGYTQLEWIQSTGTQYIDTRYTPNNNTRVVAEVETTTSISSNKWIFGQRSNSNTQRYEVIYIASADAIRFYINTSNYTFAGVGLGRLSIDVSATSATINGVSVSPSVSDFNGARSIYICDCNSNATSDEAIKQKVYSFQIYDNGTLVRDFVPARRNSDITVGLFDRANDVFYVNSGTGAFGAGPVAEGPDYIKLEYIEASGSQYIDSLVSGVLPVRVVLKMRSGTGMATTDSVMVGMYQSGKMTTPVYLYQGTWFISCGNSDGASAIGTLVDNKDYEVVSELTPTYFKCTVNGTVVINKTANSTGGANTLYLFARNDSGTATRFASGRMYSCQIYSGTTLVRDFIPARRNSDGAVGLLDQANNVFYVNAGTGTFTAGPEIASTGSLANVDNTSVLLAGCLANVGGIEYAIPYALANVDGIEVVIPFGEAYETIDAVPYQTGTLTYTGSALTPTWAGYDASTLTIGGTTSATNAGTYTATFTPVDGYVWADTMEAEPRSVNWVIGKAAGKVTLSKTSISLQAGSSTTFTVSRSGDGAISIKNSASVTNYSATLSGTTVTVGANGVGSGTITVTAAEGTNHLAASATCSVTVTVATYTISIGMAKNAYTVLSLAYFEVGGTQYDGSPNTTVTVTEGTSWTAYSRKYGISGGITVDGTHKGWNSVTGTVTSNMDVTIGVYYNGNTPYMTSVTITTS